MFRPERASTHVSSHIYIHCCTTTVSRLQRNTPHITYSAVRTPATLQSAQRENNLVGDAGASSLASALERIRRCRRSTLASIRWAMRARRPSRRRSKNTTLQTLNLGDNSVGDAGAMDFGSMGVV